MHTYINTNALWYCAGERMYLGDPRLKREKGGESSQRSLQLQIVVTSSKTLCCPTHKRIEGPSTRTHNCGKKVGYDIYVAVSSTVQYVGSPLFVSLVRSGTHHMYMLANSVYKSGIFFCTPWNSYQSHLEFSWLFERQLDIRYINEHFKTVWNW